MYKNAVKQAPNSKAYYSGYFIPENPEKYSGDLKQIIYRSSWERKFMIYCDRTESIIAWSSEALAIPYINPIDKRQHNYNIDFIIRVKQKDGNEQDFIIEVKPESQTKRPKPPKMKRTSVLNRYNKELKEYIVNISKWKAAKEYAKSNNLKFKIITEKFIGKL